MGTTHAPRHETRNVMCSQLSHQQLYDIYTELENATGSKFDIWYLKDDEESKRCAEKLFDQFVRANWQIESSCNQVPWPPICGVAYYPDVTPGLTLLGNSTSKSSTSVLKALQKCGLSVNARLSEKWPDDKIRLIVWPPE